MTAQLAFWWGSLALAVMIMVGGRHVTATRWEVGAALLIAPLLLSAVLLSSERFGDFRLRLEGVSLEQAALDRPLRVGGDSGGDDLVLADLPPALAEVRAGDDGRPSWSVRVAGAGPRGEAGAVQIFGGEDAGNVAGSEALRPGDIVCVARCRTSRAVAVRLRPDGQGFEPADGSQARFPSFKQRPMLTLFGRDIGVARRAWTAEQAIYPLRDYGVVHAPAPAWERGMCGRRLLCAADGSPVRSFVYRVGPSPLDLRVVLLDSDAEILRDGQVIARTAREPVTLPGSAAGTRFFRVTYGSPYRDIAVPGRPNSRLERRGQLNMTSENDSLTIALSRATAVPIRRTDIEQAARRGPEFLPITVMGGGAAAEAVENPLVFRPLGGALGEGLRARLLLAAHDDYGARSTRFSVAGADRPVRLGEPFKAGQARLLRAADFRLERLDLPWPAVAIAWAWFLVVLVSWSGLWTGNRPALLIVAVAQWLLAIRLLVGIESAALDPAIEFATPVGGNIAAYVALPLLLVLLTPGVAALGQRLWPPILFAAGAIAIAWQAYGESVSLVVSGLGAVGAIVAAAAGHRRLPRPPQGWMQDRLPASWWVWLLVAVVLFRIGALFALGWRERIQWPAPFAISILYVPLLLLAAAGALRHAWGSGRVGGAGTGLLFTGLLVLSLGLVPMLVGDNGLVIYLLPIMLLTFLVSSGRSAGDGRWQAFGRRLIWSGPAAAIAAFALYVGVAAVLSGPSWDRRIDAAVAQAQRATTDEARAAADSRAARLLAEVNSDDRNWLRLWTAVAPDRLSMAGTSDAESQKRVSAILADYSGTLLGRGYMEPSEPGDIRTYQADDNLSAVHIMSPFGRLGAASLLLVLGLLAWRLGGRANADATLPLAGALALWTIFMTAAWMVLGNLQWVPFTGRNIYLLAALSASDLIEGGVLFAMALRGLGRANAK